MVRPAWLVRKEEIAEDGKAVELEEFLRSAMADDDEGARAARAAPNASLTLPPHDEIDDALEALDDEVLNEEAEPGEPEQAAPDEHAQDEAPREFVPPVEEPLPALDERWSLKGALLEATVQLQARSLVPDKHEDEGPRETPALEPRPHQLEERLDEALSETFPASDPIAVSLP
jgi:hypothetical protein